MPGGHLSRCRRKSGGATVVLPGSEPLRPGAFRVEGKLPPAGRYRWALLVTAPGLSDRHDLGMTIVFPDEPAAMADAEKRPEKDPAAIAYLKEQQWTNPFATALVREGDVRTSIRVPAAIEPVTGGDALVAAPADGRYASIRLPSVGDRVAAGQELGRLEPRLSTGGEDRASLDAAVTEAQATLDGAKADLTRAERLLEERAVPGRRVEDARRTVAIAEARVMAARARLAQRDEVLRSGGGAASGNAFVLRAPIAGRVAEVFAALGASYTEGAPLFRIVRGDRVELQAQVPPSEADIGARDDGGGARSARTRRADRAQARSRSRRRRDRSENTGASASDRGGEPLRAVARRPDRHSHSVHGPHAADTGRSTRSGADGSGTTVRLRPNRAANVLRVASSRWPHETPAWSACEQASPRASAW